MATQPDVPRSHHALTAALVDLVLSIDDVEAMKQAAQVAEDARAGRVDGFNVAMIQAGLVDEYRQRLSTLADAIRWARQGRIGPPTVQVFAEAAVFFDALQRDYAPVDMHAPTAERLTKLLSRAPLTATAIELAEGDFWTPVWVNGDADAAGRMEKGLSAAFIRERFRTRTVLAQGRAWAHWYAVREGHKSQLNAEQGYRRTQSMDTLRQVIDWCEVWTARESSGHVAAASGAGAEKERPSPRGTQLPAEDAMPVTASLRKIGHRRPDAVIRKLRVRGVIPDDAPRPIMASRAALLVAIDYSKRALFDEHFPKPA